MMALTSLSSSNLEARTEPVFVYGGLTNPLLRTAACRCYVSGKELTIGNYEKVGSTILPNEGAGVTGQILYVTKAELTRLDRANRVPWAYRRVQLDTLDFSMWVYLEREQPL